MKSHLSTLTLRPLQSILALAGLFYLTGCGYLGYLRVDPMHPLIRSDVLLTPEQEQEVVSRAKLGWTQDGQVRVIYLKGSPYERGYQYGRLLREEIQDNMGFLYRQAVAKFRSAELFAEAYERMRPFISQEHIDEMHGLAHGARLPLEVVHHIHVLADLGEWGGKKKLKKIVDQMVAGDLATMCSNMASFGAASDNGELYAVRVLDWGLHKVSRLHRYPIIAVNIPNNGIPFANIGWVGYLGAVSGINAAGITLGEMGYRDPENETLRGEPMPFMLRNVLSQASNLEDVRRIIKNTIGSNSYVFLMTDGKSKEVEMYVKDRDRFLVFKPGVDLADGKEFCPAIKDTSYGGRYNDKLTKALTDNHGKLNPETFMKIIPDIAMKSNFQNVIYLPERLQFWVSNAKSKTKWAADQPYTFFDLQQALDVYQGKGE